MASEAGGVLVTQASNMAGLSSGVREMEHPDFFRTTGFQRTGLHLAAHARPREKDGASQGLPVYGKSRRGTLLAVLKVVNSGLLGFRDVPEH